MEPTETQEKRARDPVEREANYFALALLMPRDIFKRELDNTVMDLASDEPIKELANKFGVSITAVAVRMCMLNHKI